MSDSGQLSIQHLRSSLKPFAKPASGRAAWQVADTFLPYLGVWALLIHLFRTGASVFLILPLLLLGALLLVRIFIIFHDCAHGSFFASHRANVILGYVAGILTFTPYTYWKRNHLIHHASYANLDRRGVGDLWTLTVDEYRALSPLKRLAYRLYRHPLVFLGIGPGYSFLITQRFLYDWQGKDERFSATVTNVALLATLVAAGLTIGFKTYVLIQLPIVLVGGAVGVWLFYVQHQFKGVYWAHQDDWDPVKAAMEGSSHYKLPKVLQWFTGSIGLHHVHHVLPRIPNYRLQECYDAVPEMRTVPQLTLFKSLGSLRLNLWDEGRRELISFKSLAA
ncbi:fatty acid desaturase [Pseudodesulfovibrio karagichevae]|uniref:Fatty acid desaturase n=1 Tax=Pseudodesulfovibrio karagichevae TaxID=3239305 RepID=A0ABV4K1F6_9BACT